MFIFALTMYVDDHKYQIKGKFYRRVLLRHSYRESGKTKQKNIANISSCSDEEIEAIKFALKNKDNPEFLQQIAQTKTVYWKKAGACIALYQIIKQLELDKVLGKDEEGQYALWQVMARLIYPSSRLSTVRLAEQHCGCELIGIDYLTEQHLYDSLDWLNIHQDSIEKKLFKQTNKDNAKSASTLFLYDVSSSYLEGTQNELANWGYNRDKKKGKLQIVYGLLTDLAGNPLSVEAFKGNTKDTATVATQINKIKHKFECKHVVFVGDKGMIKKAEIEQLQQENLNYITTITKPQIKTLLHKEVFQMELFTNELVEVIDREDSVRYVLRKNQYRAAEMHQNRENKIQYIHTCIAKSNTYLKEHPKAKLSVQEKYLKDKLDKFNMTNYITLNQSEEDRAFSITISEEKLKEARMLDGCYAMKTDLIDDKAITKEEIYNNYKALSEVEWAFRTQKNQLFVRPIYLRKEGRTKGHLIVCMLAYKIEKYLRERWQDLDITVMEGIQQLDTIVGLKIKLGDTKENIKLAQPNEQCKALLEKVGVILPDYLPVKETIVSTKKKLPYNRK